MKKISKNNNGSMYANLISIFIIFFLFTVLSLVLIVITTDVYQDIKKQVENSNNTTALVSYITNKIKSYDCNSDSIEIIKDKKGKDVLKLQNEEEKLDTYIYIKDNTVYEQVVRKDDSLDMNMGQKLFSAKKLKFDVVNKHIIEIIIEIDNKTKVSKHVNITTDVLSIE